MTKDKREQILKEFYKLPTKNLQDSHLAGLIKTSPVKQRRPRKSKIHSHSESSDDESHSRFYHSVSFSYTVRTKTELASKYVDVTICRDAFLSFHGITRARLRRIQSCLSETSGSPLDKRGHHKNRPNKTPPEIDVLIQQHIKSFPARQSHYSLRKNPHRFYLPETLSVKDMYRLFLEKHRINVSYKVYWSIFTTKFNIKFGLPRTDTCTMCDMFRQKIEASKDKQEEKKQEALKELHLRKAEAFYTLKRKWKQEARTNQATVISFDFMQNLPLPHIRTNTVFYARQLWYFVFGVHDFADDSASMYVYDESVGKKGQNDVTSHLFHFLRHKEITATETLVIFSDGCAGQNKNYTMVRFLYFVVHVLNLFKSVVHIFPIRGHSFMPNDQDFSIISKKKEKVTVETPQEWDNIIANCRLKPSPFKVINVNKSNLFDVKKAIEPYFLKTPKLPLKMKTLIMYKISQENPDIVLVRESYSGPWSRSLIRSKTKLTKELTLTPLYTGPIAINPLKVKSLLDLCPTLSKSENKAFYESFDLNRSQQLNQNIEEVDSEDNSSGCES